MDYVHCLILYQTFESKNNTVIRAAEGHKGTRSPIGMPSLVPVASTKPRIGRSVPRGQAVREQSLA